MKQNLKQSKTFKFYQLPIFLAAIFALSFHKEGKIASFYEIFSKEYCINSNVIFNKIEIFQKENFYELIVSEINKNKSKNFYKFSFKLFEKHDTVFAMFPSEPKANVLYIKNTNKVYYSCDFLTQSNVKIDGMTLNDTIINWKIKDFESKSYDCYKFRVYIEKDKSIYRDISIDKKKLLPISVELFEKKNEQMDYHIVSFWVSSELNYIKK